MGLHRDADEADFSFPVLSVSLGDTALFRLGGRDADPTGQSGWPPAMSSSWAARRGAPTTASTASSPAALG